VAGTEHVEIRLLQLERYIDRRFGGSQGEDTERSQHFWSHLTVLLTKQGWWMACFLSASNCNQIFIPEWFTHGYCMLKPNTEVVYQVGVYCSPKQDRGSSRTRYRSAGLVRTSARVRQESKAPRSSFGRFSSARGWRSSRSPAAGR
jgi:hypothetical protein